MKMTCNKQNSTCIIMAKKVEFDYHVHLERQLKKKGDDQSTVVGCFEGLCKVKKIISRISVISSNTNSGHFF